MHYCHYIAHTMEIHYHSFLPLQFFVLLGYHMAGSVCGVLMIYPVDLAYRQEIEDAYQLHVHHHLNLILRAFYKFQQRLAPPRITCTCTLCTIHLVKAWAVPLCKLQYFTEIVEVNVNVYKVLQSVTKCSHSPFFREHIHYHYL